MALLFLVILAPLLIIIAVCVRATSPGPALYRQVRVGYRGIPFVIYKFRTMRVGSDRSPTIVLPGDSRVTTFGKVLRSYHLDELPQLVNIAKGEMAFVGPRPVPRPQVRAIESMPAYRARNEVLPGLTGLVQVRGRIWAVRRGSLAVLRLEAFYARHACWLLDLRIVWQTIGVVLGRKGV